MLWKAKRGRFFVFLYNCKEILRVPSSAGSAWLRNAVNCKGGPGSVAKKPGWLVLWCGSALRGSGNGEESVCPVLVNLSVRLPFALPSLVLSRIQGILAGCFIVDVWRNEGC